MHHFFSSKRGDSLFQISGHIYSMLDITKKGSLDKFVKIIKQIKLSKSLQNRANKLDLKDRYSVQNITQLKNGIYDVNWKKFPNIYNIPSLSQIFGRLVKNAGIESILYKSTKKSKHGLCMAVFPENFKNSDSYLQLENCPKNIIDKKICSKTYENFY